MNNRMVGDTASLGCPSELQTLVGAPGEIDEISNRTALTHFRRIVGGQSTNWDRSAQKSKAYRTIADTRRQRVCHSAI